MGSDSSKPDRTGSVSADGISGTFTTTCALIIGYLSIQIAANLTVAKTTSILGHFSIPIGSLLYPVSYTWIDLVNHRLGKANARKLVAIAIIANILIVAWFQIYIHIAGTDVWNQDRSNQNAIEFVLGAVPRIYAASVITNFIAENVDISIFHLVRRRYPRSPIWVRSAASNTVSTPLDGTLFALLAFYGTVPPEFLVTIMFSSIMYKLVIGYLSIPLVSFIRRER